MQLYADLGDVVLPVKVVVGNESGQAAFEIMKPVLVVLSVTTGLFM